jgi:hypothetical protein
MASLGALGSAGQLAWCRAGGLGAERRQREPERGACKPVRPRALWRAMRLACAYWLACLVRLLAYLAGAA